MGTAGPGTAGIGTAGMGAASMGAASMGAASMGAAGMGAAGMGAASMGTTSYGPASPAHEPLGQHATQEAYFAGTRSTTRTAPVSAQEATELKYLRHTRNATVFIAIIVGIFTAIALIGVIWTAVTVAKLNSDLNGVSNGINSNFNSNCASQGGTNPDC